MGLTRSRSMHRKSVQLYRQQRAVHVFDSFVSRLSRRGHLMGANFGKSGANFCCRARGAELGLGLGLGLGDRALLRETSSVRPSGRLLWHKSRGGNSHVAKARSSFWGRWCSPSCKNARPLGDKLWDLSLVARAFDLYQGGTQRFMTLLTLS